MAAALSAVLLAGRAGSQEAAAPAAEQAVRDLLERECVNLDKEKLYGLIVGRLAAELEQGPSPDLLRIMEGVVKRTDFDSIPEEKTVEIIGLVHGAFRKGAPLEFLDDIFDVAYVNTVSVDQLAEAAKALQELHRSDVPQDIYEEFVYHSIEGGWDPAAMPVLTRGLIYGVDRGLSPDKVALIIMLDMKNGEMKDKTPEQLVLDSIKLVREKEPQKWKPLSGEAREAAKQREQAAALEKRQRAIDQELEQRERAFLQAQRELRELREYPAERPPEIDVDKLNRDLEQLIRNLQREITRYQDQRGSIAAQLETARRAAERQQAVRDRDRQKRRERELARTQQTIASRGGQGRLNRERLFSVVDQYMGTPYRFGGDSDRGIDCSAFTRRVYRGQNVELPRNSREQARVSSSVVYNGLKTGDLVFFNTSINGVISHVGVYLGNGTFAHASSSKGVTKSSIKERYYVKRFVKGGRVFAN
jgi:cell wall-associated NlpC family hydrolase